MLLYGRFTVPDGASASDGNPVRVRDQANGRDIVLYRAAVQAAEFGRRFDDSSRIVSRWKEKRPGKAEAVALFSSPGSIWLMAPDTETVAPLLGELRTAAIFPTPVVQRPKQETPPPPPRPEPIPPPAPPPAPRCAKCGNNLPFEGAACARCRRRRGFLLAVNRALLVVLGLCVAALFLREAFTSLTSRKSQPAPVEIAPPPVAKPSRVPRPEVTFQVNAGSVKRGETIILRWRARHAQTVTIEPGIGPVETSGSFDLKLDADTVFTLTATGPGGSVQKQLSVAAIETASRPLSVVSPTPPAQDSTPTPVPAAPSVSFSALPETPVQVGSPVHLTWTTENASAVSISGIGPVKPSGSLDYTPAASTTLILSAKGAGGTTTKPLSISVAEAAPLAKPTATLTLNGVAGRQALMEGETARLCWSTTNAEQVTLGTIRRDPNGCFDQPMSTPGSFNYTLTATGKGGSASARVDFIVRSRTAHTASGDVLWTGTPDAFSHVVTITWRLVSRESGGGQWQLGSDVLGSVLTEGRNPSLYATRLRQQDLTVPGNEAVILSAGLSNTGAPAYSIRFRCNRSGLQTVRLRWVAELPANTP